jgi:hypothetical protein
MLKLVAGDYMASRLLGSVKAVFYFVDLAHETGR